MTTSLSVNELFEQRSVERLETQGKRRKPKKPLRACRHGMRKKELIAIAEAALMGV